MAPSPSNSAAPPGPYCLGCSYSLHGLTESRCPECGRGFDLDDPRTYRLEPLSKMAAYWFFPPGRRSTWFPLILAIIAIISNAIPEGFFPAMILIIYGWLACLGWWLSRLIIWSVASLATGFAYQTRRMALRWLITPGIFAAMCISLILRLPLYASFFVSLPSMNQTAQQCMTITGAPPSISRIGIYPVSKLETFAGGMRFIVTGSGFFDAGGFAYSQNGPPPRIGEDYYRHLWGPWYEWRESW